MSKFTEMWDKVLKEKLVAKTKVGNTDFSLNDKGTISAKGKIGSTDVSADSKGNVQATGKIAGGTMSTAVNKDGDGGSAFTDKKGRTVSHTAGDTHAWVSAGPGQISKRVALSNSKEIMGKITEDETVQYDSHGFATVHHNGKFYLIFNDEVVGEYDTIEELKAAHEHVINKIKLPEDEQMNEESNKEWELIINGNPWMKYTASNVDEVFDKFFKEVQEDGGAERFLADMIEIHKLNTNESITELDNLRKNAGL